MGSLVAACLIGWGGVAAYLCWMGIQNAMLARRFRELKELVQSNEDTRQQDSLAA